MTHIHIADSTNDNVRMILPPSSNGEASVVYTYTVSGLGSADSMTFDDTHIHIANSGAIDNVRMILPPSSNGEASVVYTYTVSGVDNATGMAFDGTHIHIANSGADSIDDNVRMILPPSSNGEASVVYTYTVSGMGSIRGMTFDGTHIHIADRVDDNVRMILPPSSNGEASVVYTYTVSGVDNATGMAFDDTHIHIANSGAIDNVRMILPPSSNGEASVVYTYTVSGMGNLTGMAFDGAIQSQATLTLSTTETDRRGGVPFTVDIASDIDISDFAIGDISVSNGTASNFAMTDAQNFTVDITPNTGAGTVTVSIAEDAVSPGNAAVSQGFSYVAKATVTLVFDDDSVIAGQSATASATFSETPTGLTTADFTISDGTVDSVTGTGLTRTVTITAPSTGSGTITLTLAADSIDQGNNADSDTIDWTQPLALGWIVPTSDVGNTFSVTLTSNHALTGVALSDFRLIARNPTNFITLATSDPDIDSVSLTQISGTHNYRIDIVLSGTYDQPFEIRLLNNQALFGSMTVPTSNLNSAQWNVDSSIGVNTAPSFSDASYSFPDTAIANNTVVGTVAATDADSDPLTYSLTGADATKFSIDADGEITAAEALDYETAYNFNVVANDGTTTTSVGVTVNTFIEINLTGTGVSLGNSQFGASESYARAAASDGSAAYNFGRTQGYTLDVSSGASTQSGSAWSGSGQIRGATFHNSQVLVYIDSRNIHVWTPGTGFNATALISNLRYATGSGFSGNPSINGFASHQGVLYVADGNENHLFSVGTDGILTAIGSGYGSRNIGGLTSHEGRLLATDNTNDRLALFNTADGTVTNVANNELLGSRSIDFLVSQGEELYGGQFLDGLLRFYNVLWDETITNPQTDEGDSETVLDLSTVSRDAASYALQGANPSWMSVSGDNLVATNAPAVTTDTDYDVGVRATRDAINVDKTIEVTVRNTGTPRAPTITFDPATVRNGRVTEATIEWDSDVTGFTVADLSVDAGSLSNFTAVDADTYTVDITAPATGSGDITLTIAENAVDETNSQATATVAYSALPTATIVFDPSSVMLSETSQATITWSETVTGFTIADVSVDVGTLSNFSGSGDTYTVDVTSPNVGSGNITLTIAEDAVSVGNAEITGTIAYAQTIPDDAVLSITTTDTDIREGEAVDFSITSDIAITGFTASDISLTGGTRGALTENSSTSYTLRVTAGSGAGTIVISIPEDVVSPGNAEASQTFTRNALPTASVVFNPTTLRGGRTTTATITWSEAVAGFAIGDLSADVGTLSNFSTTSTTVYTVDITAPNDDTSGDIRLIIAANAITIGNAEITATIAYTAAPTIAITTTDTDIRENENVDFSIVFSEAVTNFAQGDITVTGASINALAGGGSSHTLKVTAASGAGQIVISIAANVVDPANQSASATFPRSSASAATATITFAEASVRGGNTTTATITFDQDVKGLAIGDLSMNRGTLSNFSGSDDAYTVDITAPYTGSDLILTLAANAVNEGNAEAQGTLNFIPAIRQGLFVLGEENSVWSVNHIPDNFRDGQSLSNLDVITTPLLPTLESPSAATIDADGNLYVILQDVSTNLRNIYVIPTASDAAGSGYIQRTILLPSTISDAHGIAIDSTGNLFIADASNNRIYIIDADTVDNTPATITRTILMADTITAISGLALDDTNRILYIADNITSTHDDVIHTIDADTSDNTEATIIKTILLPNIVSNPFAIAFADDNLYISRANNDGIFVIDAETADQTEATVIKTILISDLTNSIYVGGLTIDSSGNLYIAEFNTNTVYVIDSTTANNTQATASRTLPFDIYGKRITGASLDDSRNLYLLSQRQATSPLMYDVLVLNADSGDGYIQRHFTLPNPLPNSFSRLGLAIDGNDLYISSELGFNEFIHVFNADTAPNTAAALIRTFTISNITLSPQGIAIDASRNLYILNDRGNVDVVAANTPNNTIANILKTILTPDPVFGLQSRTGFVIDGDGNLYLIPDRASGFDGQPVPIFVFDAATADQTEAIFTAQATVPSAIREPGKTAYQSGLSPPIITTTATNIRSGITIDFDIVFPESVDNFDLNNIQIEGATGNTLSGFGRNYVLSATADSGAGEIEITIPSDIVSPGNFESTATFQRLDLAMVTLEFSQSDVRAGEQTVAVATFSEDVDGLLLTDFTLDQGTLDALEQDSNSVYRILMTAPSTGNGIMRLTLAANAVTQGNANTAAFIFYFEGIRHGIYALQGSNPKGIHVLPDYVPVGETLADQQVASFSFLPELHNLSGLDIDASGNLYALLRYGSTTEYGIYQIPTSPTAEGSGYIQKSVLLRDSTSTGVHGTTQLGSPNGLALNASDTGAWIVDGRQDFLYHANFPVLDNEFAGFGAVVELPSSIGDPTGVARDNAGNFYIVDATDRRVYIVEFPSPFSDGTLARTILLPTEIADPTGLTVDNNGNLYIADNAGDEIYVIAANTPNNTIATITKTIRLPNTIDAPNALAILDNALYVGDRSDIAIYRINANTPNNTEATIQQTINLSRYINSPEAITLDDNANLYVADRATFVTDPGRKVYVLNADAADGAIAYIQKTIILPSEITDPRGLTTRGNILDIIDGVDAAIYSIAADTPDSTIATLTKTLNLPSAISDPQGLAYYDNRYYIADDVDNDIYEVDATTPNNGTAPITKTIPLPIGVVNIRGIVVAGDLIHIASPRTAGDSDSRIVTIRRGSPDNVIANLMQTIVLPSDIDMAFGLAFQTVPRITTSLNLEITTPYPTRYVSDIGLDNPGYYPLTITPTPFDDPDDLNDFPVYFKWNQDVEGFTQDDIQVFNGSVQSFEKISSRLYIAIIRPPDAGTGGILIRVRLNAIHAGNNQEDVVFAYTDRVDATLLFNISAAITNYHENILYPPPIHIDGSRIHVLGGEHVSDPIIFTLDQSGSRLMDEEIVIDNTFFPDDARGIFLRLINGIWYVRVLTSSVFRFDNGSGFRLPTRTALPRSVDLNRWGLFSVPNDENEMMYGRDFSDTEVVIQGGRPAPFALSETYNVAWQDAVAVGDRVYWNPEDTLGTLLPLRVFRSTSQTQGQEIVSERLSPLVSDRSNPYNRISVYGDQMFFTDQSYNLYRFDLPKYRAPEVRNNILPQFIIEGESRDLKVLVKGAEFIDFEFGFDTPSYLSIDSNLKLDVADGVIAEDTTVLVKLSAFSLRAQTDFEFYLHIRKKKAPVAKDIDILPMDDGETYNLLRLFEGADSVDFKSGFSVPSGYSITDSELTLTGQTSEALTEIQVTGTNAEGGTDLTLDVHPRVSQAIVSSDNFAFRFLIAGIDVSVDLLQIPNSHFSLDVLRPNEFVSDSASFVLSNTVGRYDGRVSGNFWESNNLNTNGYLEPVALWVDISDTGSVQSKMLFDGIINRNPSNINNISITLNCVDQTYLLKNDALIEVGLKKVAHLAEVTETYQGEYKPDDTLLPILPNTAEVVDTDRALDISPYKHAPSAVIPTTPTAYIDDSRVFTSGGYLTDDPLLRFKTPYQSREIGFLIRQLSEASGYFNPSVDIASAEDSTDNHILSRGNVAFNVEQTKTSRTVVDWVHDATNNIRYILLSHPSAYIEDILVSCDVNSDTYLILHTFDYGIQATQLTTDDFDTFYVIATTATEIDFTESPDPPNHNAAVFDKLDSSRETEDTRILRYVHSTGTQTTFVDTDDDRPVQVGLHYMAGFENQRHIRLREGVFSEARSTFRVHGGELYYRWATWNEFGVAIATSSGTTSAAITVDRDDYFNTLNFDFDIQSNGDVYMVYADDGELKIRLYDASANTQSDIFTDSTETYLGCHEALLDSGHLYFVAPIHNSDRDIKITAGAVLDDYDISANSLTALREYDYVQLSCRSLTVHGGSIYFAEYPNASTHYTPSNPDLSDYNADTRANTVEPNEVWLKRIDAGVVEDVASPWYDEHNFNATAVKMISTSDGLHAIVRYADAFDISAVDSDASRPENEQWVVFGNEIPYYVEDVPTGSLYDVLTTFATVSNSRLEVVGSRLRFVDIDPYQVLLDGGITDAAMALDYDGANKAFPASGYVLIGSEIIQYTGRTPTQLTGLTRGVGGTTAAAHTDNDKVLYLDKVVNRGIDTPYSAVSIDNDANKFYNVVRDSDDFTEATDTASVDRYGRREFVSNLPLSVNQIAWRRYLNEKTLDRLKDVKSIVRATLPASYYLNIGDRIYFDYEGEISIPIEIIDLRHTQSVRNERTITQTHIIGQEIV